MIARASCMWREIGMHAQDSRRLAVCVASVDSPVRSPVPRPVNAPVVALAVAWLGGNRLAERHLGELGPRVDVQLHEHLTQVIIDRAWAEEQLSSDLRVGFPGGHKACDLQLLGRELVARRGVAPTSPLTAGAQLRTSARLPRPRADLLETTERSPQVRSRVGAATVTAKPLAVQELAASLVERRQRGCELDRLGEVALGVFLVDQPPAPCEERESEGVSRLLGPMPEPLGVRRDLVEAIDADSRLARRQARRTGTASRGLRSAPSRSASEGARALRPTGRGTGRAARATVPRTGRLPLRRCVRPGPGARRRARATSSSSPRTASIWTRRRRFQLAGHS